MTDYVPVVLPSGQQVWVRADPSASEGSGVRDISVTGAALAALQVQGFAETVTGVVSSVRMAMDRHRPDSVAVEFGIEINAKTGKALSVLAEAGGKTHVKVTATWGSSAIAGGQSVEQPPEPDTSDPQPGH